MRPQQVAKRLADNQLGLITHQQAIGTGLSGIQVRHLVEQGDLLPLHRGVYRTAGSTDSIEQRALAAVFACGPTAIASHVTAAQLWHLVENTEQPLHITISADRSVQRPGIIVHRTQTLTSADRTKKGLVPLTTPSRTLIDLATMLDTEAVEAAVDEALRQRRTHPHVILRLLERHPNAKGIASLRKIVEDRLGHGVPETEIEREMLRLISRYSLPAPVRQLRDRANGRGVRFDLVYPDQKLIVELEGAAPHWGRDRWQSDHDRHNDVTIAYWRPLYFTWVDVTERAGRTAIRLGEALGLIPSRWSKA